VTVTLDAGATAGNLIAAMCTWNNPLTYATDPTGFTAGPRVPATTGNLSSATFWKIAAGGETAVTFGATGASPTTVGGFLAEFAGPFAASPLDKSAENEAHIGTAVTSCASGTTDATTQADELLLAFFGADQATLVEDGRAYTNSFTEVGISGTGVNRAASIIAKRVVSATGTYSTTFSTSDTGDEMYGAIMTFKKLASGSILRQMMQHHH
jgi:hypothetical protein